MAQKEVKDKLGYVSTAQTYSQIIPSIETTDEETSDITSPASPGPTLIVSFDFLLKKVSLSTVH